jgi:hypothetical protein
VKRLGIVINGVELIPAEVFERHIPFAVPPGQTAVTAWAFEEPDGALTAADLKEEIQRLRAERDAFRALLEQVWEMETELRPWTPDPTGFVWERIGAALQGDFDAARGLPPLRNPAPAVEPFEDVAFFQPIGAVSQEWADEQRRIHAALWGLDNFPLPPKEASDG